MAINNRITRYLSDLAYALDYAYNTRIQNSDDLAIMDGQNSSLRPESDTCFGILGQMICGCRVVDGYHCNDIISEVLKLRNPTNLISGTQTITPDNIIKGYSAYDSSGNLISGTVECRDMASIEVNASGASNTVAATIDCKICNTNSITAQYLQIDIPKGCYKNSAKVIYDVGECDPKYAYQNQYWNDNSYCWNTQTTLSSGNTINHCYGAVYLYAYPGYYTQDSSVCLVGATCYACSGYCDITPTSASKLLQSGQISYPSGYYENVHGAKYSLTHESDGPVVVANSSNKLSVTPPKGYWSGTDVLTTNTSYYECEKHTIYKGGTSRVLPSGYYSKDHSVTVDISDATFVIDTDEKLTAWVNQTSGNDYSFVVIKGERNLNNSKSVIADLDNIGTKILIGAPGSKINITTSTTNGYNISVFMGSNCIIQNINIDINASGSLGVIGFNGCSNLFDCTCTLRGYSNNAWSCFRDCKNLYNCQGFTTGQSCFVDCEDLISCSGSVMTGGGVTSYHIFSRCFRLTQCTATASLVSGLDYYSGFSSCKDLNQCNVVSSNATINMLHGFDSCHRLENCRADITGKFSNEATGFSSCDDVVLCRGKCVNSIGTGYAFSYCQKVRLCGKLADTSSTSGTFQSCYSSTGNTTANAAANTPAGGWNVA